MEFQKRNLDNLFIIDRILKNRHFYLIYFSFLKNVVNISVALISMFQFRILSLELEFN